MKDLVDEGLAHSQLRTRHRGFRRSAQRGLAGEAQPQQRRCRTARWTTLYARAQAAGAIGGKLTGAGGGGFLLLFVRPEHQQAVRDELSDLIHVPVKFDFSGSQIIYYEPEQDYSAARAVPRRRRPSRPSASSKLT